MDAAASVAAPEIGNSGNGGGDGSGDRIVGFDGNQNRDSGSSGNRGIVGGGRDGDCG